MNPVEIRAIRNAALPAVALPSDRYTVSGYAGPVQVCGGTASLCGALYAARKLGGISFFTRDERGTVCRGGRPVATVYGGASR